MGGRAGHGRLRRRSPMQRAVPNQRPSTDASTSARMGQVRQHGTSAELAVRRLVSDLGFRYRVSNRGLAGSPDLANRSRERVIFVHGCFWHRHRRCSRTTTPKRNRQFWLEKFADNEARDRRVTRTLRRQGFKVVVIWECQIEQQPGAVARRLAKALGTAAE